MKSLKWFGERGWFYGLMIAFWMWVFVTVLGPR